MKTKLLTVLTIIGVVIFAAPAFSAVPHLINYQGFLTDDTAVPLDGPYNLTFKIYPDSAQGVQALWSELHVGVDISAGLFNVILGGTTTIPDSLLEGAERWMGLAVGTDPEMYPKMRLTAVPWALRAAVADSALTSPAGSADGHSLDAADGLPIDALYVDNDGNVGIGTLSPGAKLDLAGTLLAAGFKMPTGAASGHVLVSDSAGVGTWQPPGSGGGGDITAVRPMDGLWSPDTGESGDVHLYVLVVPGSGLMVDPIDGVSIEPEGVTEDKIAASAVTTSKLDSAAVTGGKIASAAVGVEALAGAAVTNEKLATYAVADSNLIANSVTTDKLLNGAVLRDKIDDLAIDSSKLDANAVNSAKIQDNSISFGDIAQNSASEGQVMKWTGGHWVARDDSLGGGGTIDGVWGGTGLTGGGSTGSVTLDVDFGGTGADTTVSRSDHNHDVTYVNEGQVSSISEAMLLDRAVATAKLDTNAVTTDKILTGTILLEDFGQNGAADGQVIKWSDASSAWVTANDSVGSGGSGGNGGWYDDGSVVRLDAGGDSVGIGTVFPNEKLEVVGNLRVQGKAAIGPGHAYSGLNAFVAGENNTVSGDQSTVGGGMKNFARGEFSVVSGGGGNSDADSNSAVSNHCVVGGGLSNVAGYNTGMPEEGAYATVSGGVANRALNQGATVSGGGGNVVGRRGTIGNPDEGLYATVSGGRYNNARGRYSVVGGGGGEDTEEANRAFGGYSVIGGGFNNITGDTMIAPMDNFYATIGGGGTNTAYTRGATVAGGSGNTAGVYSGGGGPQYDGEYATVGGGRSNRAEGKYSVVAGGGDENPGWYNRAFSDYSVVGGGGRNTAGDTLAAPDEDEYATVGGGFSNQAYGRNATIGGGSENRIGQLGGGPNEYGDYGTIGGGRYNWARGKYSVVSGGGTESGPWANRAEGDYSVVGGGENNVAGDGGSPETTTHATVSGGEDNQASQQHSTVGGGSQNAASGPASVVAGGTENTAQVSFSAVGGGYQNTASGPASTIGGGSDNDAAGQYATVPGGWENIATGDYSFAAGSVAKAHHDGCVVISATSSGAPGDSVWTNGNSEMVLRADNGFYLTKQGEQSSISGFLNTSTGAWLNDAGQWRDASSRALKENFTDVDKGELLKKLAALPVTQWNYKVDDDGVKHVGPVAQDFYATFGIGDDDVSLAALDVAGVSLAAIQELTKQNKTQKKEINELKTQVSELQKMVRALIAQQKEVSANDKSER